MYYVLRVRNKENQTVSKQRSTSEVGQAGRTSTTDGPLRVSEVAIIGL